MIALQPSYLPFPRVLDVYVDNLSSKGFTGLKRENMEGLPDTDDCHRHEPSQAIAEVWLYGLKKDKAARVAGQPLVMSSAFLRKSES